MYSNSIDCFIIFVRGNVYKSQNGKTVLTKEEAEAEIARTIFRNGEIAETIMDVCRLIPLNFTIAEAPPQIALVEVETQIVTK